MRKARFLWAPTLLLGAAFLAHLPALGSDFVHWDDYHLVLRNPLVQTLSLKSFLSYDPELYVPLSFLSYQFEHALFGFHPLPYHVTNLLLHAGNALLTFAFLRKFLHEQKNDVIAFLGALIFAVHPLHVEAVSWVSARRDLLMTMFVLASLVTYASYQTCHAQRSGAKTKYFLSLLFFLLALLSKPTAIVLAVIFPLMDWLQGSLNTKSWKRYIPFIALSGVFVFINLVGQAHTNFPLAVLETVLLAARSIVFTLQRFFFPFHLTILYPATPAWSAPYIGSLIFLLSLAALLWRLHRNRMIVFGALFFLFTLAPGLLSYMKSDLVTLAPDHYSYLPSIGILMTLYGFLHCHAERSAGLSLDMPLDKLGATRDDIFASAKTKYVAAALFIVTLGFVSFRQSLLWQNSETLFIHALEEQPTHIAWNNLGVTFLEQGRSGDAETAFEQALALNPRSMDAHLNLASIAHKNGDLMKTEEHIRAAAAINPEHPEVQFNLGGIHFLKGEFDAAIIAYRSAIQLQPDFARAHLQLAKTYLKKGMWEEAKAAYAKALELQPAFHGSIPALEIK